MSTTTDVLVITAAHEQELSAEAALVMVTIQGTSLVTGRAALTQAKEVSRLVEEIDKCGIASSDIRLKGVHAEVVSGILGKASAAIYRLEVKCEKLELLPDLLGAITSAKNARLDELIWRYAESTELEAEWLRLAIADANVKAKAAAAALGTRITGIHHLTEERTDTPDRRSLRHTPIEGMARSRVQLGFELKQERSAGVRVIVQYRIEGYAP